MYSYVAKPAVIPLCLCRLSSC